MTNYIVNVIIVAYVYWPAVMKRTTKICVEVNGNMETQPMTDKIVSFKVSTNFIIALDEKGRMWYRELPAYSYTATGYTTGNTNKKKEEQEEKYLWRLMPMITPIDREPIPVREIPPEATTTPINVIKTENSEKEKIDVADDDEVAYSEYMFGGMAMM